jgi:hypothetical protein
MCQGYIFCLFLTLTVLHLFFYNLALRRVQKQILRILKHLTFVNKEVTFE